MPFGYLGTTPNQQLKNSGVFSVEEALQVQKDGEWGGSLELISTQTGDGSSLNIDFTSIKENKYDVHLLQLQGIFFAGTNKLPRMRLSNDGGSSFEAGTNYVEAYQSMVASTFSEVKSTGQGYFNLMNNVGNEATEVGNSYTYLYNLGNSSKYSFCTYHSTSQTSGGTYYAGTFGGGVYEVAETINAIRIFEATTTHNITGTAKLYGVKQI
tara:strand:- start:682 stop:1314 length:633 start_codon:yes stop_codon:yes gene_type:complete